MFCSSFCNTNIFIKLGDSKHQPSLSSEILDGKIRNNIVELKNIFSPIDFNFEFLANVTFNN